MKTTTMMVVVMTLHSDTNNDKVGIMTNQCEWTLVISFRYLHIKTDQDGRPRGRCSTQTITPDECQVLTRPDIEHWGESSAGFMWPDCDFNSRTSWILQMSCHVMSDTEVYYDTCRVPLISHVHGCAKSNVHPVAQFAAELTPICVNTKLSEIPQCASGWCI